MFVGMREAIFASACVTEVEKSLVRDVRSACDFGRGVRGTVRFACAKGVKRRLVRNVRSACDLG